MRWPWTKQPATECGEPPQPRHDDDERGLNEAHAALDRALSQWPEVTEVASAIRGIRRRNHLADKINDAWGGHPR